MTDGLYTEIDRRLASFDTVLVDEVALHVAPVLLGAGTRRASEQGS